MLQRTLRIQIAPNTITHLGVFEVKIMDVQGTKLQYELRHTVGESAIKEDTNEFASRFPSLSEKLGPQVHYFQKPLF